MPTKNSETAAIKKLQSAVSELVNSVDGGTLSSPRLKHLRSRLTETLSTIDEFGRSLDPVTRPRAVFDPANPNVVGAFIALALQAQKKILLNEIDRFYGSGIYAIYYEGGFNAYTPLSGTEHPIYTGKSDPKSPIATDPVGQGEKLSKRLKEHAKNIGKASNLDIKDFRCRYLVVQSGWQIAAETFLIDWFKPIWNTEIKICFGIGKHGDSPGTRKNLRSPWDTMHPGRDWAHRDDKMGDKKPEERIRREIRDHLKANPPLRDQQAILERFFQSIKQH